MRVSCHIAVQPSSSTAKPKSPCNGSIELARKKSKKKGAKDDHSLVIVCPWKVDAYAVVRENVASIFKNFVNQGRLTIQFNAPPHTLLISEAKPEELSKLFRLLEQVLSKGAVSDPEQLRQSCTALKDRSTATIPKHMVITNKKEYPRDGFPHTLNHLKIHAALCAVDTRWFQLQYLGELDLSNNRLSMLTPEDWKKFSGISALPGLKRLSLQQNGLKGQLPEIVWKSLPLSITQLDLSRNQFTAIPEGLFRLVYLRELNLGHNELSKLPDDIALPLLLHLNICVNRLRYLPATLYRASRYQIDVMHIRGNCFAYPTSNPRANQVGRITVPLARRNVPSLVELAAAVVLERKIRFADDYMPVLLRRSLRSLVERCCDCGVLFARSFSTERKLAYYSNSKISRTVITDHTEVAYSPLFGHLCRKCGAAFAGKEKQWQCDFGTLAQENAAGDPTFYGTPFLDLLST